MGTTKSRMRTALLGLAAAGFLLAGCEDWRAARMMRAANELGAQGRWSEALHFYERLWVQFPGAALEDEARLRAARIYAGPQNKPRSAEEIYRHLVLRAREQPVRVQALLELADVYALQQQNMDRAIEVLEVWLQRFPKHADQPEAALKLAEYYLSVGRLYEALLEAERVTGVDDPEIQARALEIAAHARELAGASEAALQTYDLALTAATEGSDRWIVAAEGRARVLEETGRWREAVTALTELRLRHPNPAAVDRWLAAIEERHAEMRR